MICALFLHFIQTTIHSYTSWLNKFHYYFLFNLYENCFHCAVCVLARYEATHEVDYISSDSGDKDDGDYNFPGWLPQRRWTAGVAAEGEAMQTLNKVSFLSNYPSYNHLPHSTDSTLVRIVVKVIILILLFLCYYFFWRMKLLWLWLMLMMIMILTMSIMVICVIGECW